MEGALDRNIADLEWDTALPAQVNRAAAAAAAAGGRRSFSSASPSLALSGLCAEQTSAAKSKQGRAGGGASVGNKGELGQEQEAGAAAMASEELLHKVQALIERCLQVYMNQKEVIDALSQQAKIDPGITELVWRQLEQQNPLFFKAYYMRLMLKNQIMVFNKLLEDQLQIMSKEFPSGIPSMSLPNGSSSDPLKQNSCFLPETAPGSAMPDGIMHNGSSSGIINGTPSGDQLLNASKDMHVLHSGIDASTSLQSDQNATAVLFGVDNGTRATIKTESGYSSNADFAFCGNTFLESCQSIGDASGGGSFSSSELNGQPLNDSILDMESSSFSFLNQIPQSFIFSDLAEDFSQSAEMTTFLTSETNNFSDSTGGDHTGLTVSLIIGHTESVFQYAF
ncbi:hypothetical protein C2845_PM10G21160 [Panicum miliaceum]|uniref:Uncharacterized protein n=1 Tax=Panicum miliaceum TaxID=4540 RepID=A0A3L6PBB1_PANMI|nr:hypothetical protein C2845_PM10G21160 [Panicum miliaceum]